MNGDNQLRFYLKKEAIANVYLPHLESYDKRINVFYGGAGSGKSYFVTQKLIFKFLKDPGRKGLVIRKVQNTLRDSIFAQFIEILSDWQLLDKCRVNKSFLEIELPNGATFLFKGMDDPEKIKSITDISDIVVEEATELNAGDFKQLRLRLRNKRRRYNQIHLMFNPVSKANWVYPTWFAEDSIVPKNTVIVHTTYKDNEFLDQDYIDDVESYKLTDYKYYEVYALGKFASLDKLVYTNVSIEDFDYREILKSNKKIEAHFGLDFGYTADPTAFVATLLDRENKKIYIFDEFYERGLLNNEIANEIIKRGYRKERILADHEPRTVAEIERLGVSKIKQAKKGGGSILNGIQYIQQHEIIVHPYCVNAIEELKNYSWMKDKKGEYINKPIDEYNHLLDALRYALSETHNTGRVKLLDRRMLGL